MTVHNVLYALPDGSFKNSSSYSARDTFKFCKRKFQLQRVRGWRSRRDGAALDFGKIVEAAVQWHIQHAGSGGRAKFVELWTAFKSSKGFEKKVWAKAEVSWENCLRIGDEWMQIFAIRFKTYPLDNAKFQVPLRKKIFPGTTYDSLVNVAYLDILSSVHPNHPMLVPVKGLTGRRELIIDVKTASKELNSQMVVLDPQLIEYAWMWQRPDVAFLWFVKMSHGVKFKSRVTLLTDAAPFKAGDEVFVLEKDGLDVWVTTFKNANAYAKAHAGPDGKDVTGKAAAAVSAKFFAAGYAVKVPLASVSKQRVQFATARISQQSMDDMGKVVGQTTVEMVVAHEQNFYPMEPGVRYPSEKCPRCDMRFICAGDDVGRDKFLVREGSEPEDGDQEDLEEVRG